MENAHKVNFFTKITVPVLCGVLALINFGSLSVTAAKAEAPVPEARYCAEGEARYLDEGDEPSYDGQGGIVGASYDVYYDYKTIVEDVYLYSVPSFGNANSSMPNSCAPVAGTNIVGYYDRWSPNLIPDYTPGAMVSGNYRYYPDMSREPVKNPIASLYNLMQTNVNGGGTSESEFMSGLTTYVTNAGYSLSYTSFHQNATMVDLPKLKTAINAGKVGLVMCSKYNFVYGIMHYDGHTQVAKENGDAGHMMMVYGYKTIAYYKDGVNFQTDTFLYTCSGYGAAETGYMQLNDYSQINNALVMTIA